ncbi:MAG: hypothetical protein EXS36_02735 [Pedosphaera sp.]|nr:hypothetical protein [Pedosphaera sp.]
MRGTYWRRSEVSRTSGRNLSWRWQSLDSWVIHGIDGGGRIAHLTDRNPETCGIDEEDFEIEPSAVTDMARVFWI